MKKKFCCATCRRGPGLQCMDVPVDFNTTAAAPPAHVLLAAVIWQAISFQMGVLHCSG